MQENETSTREKNTLQAGNAAGHYGCSVILPNDIPQKILGLLPARIALHDRALPLCMNGNQLIVAIADPSNLPALDSVRTFLEQQDVEFVCIAADLLDEALLRYYGNSPHPRIQNRENQLEENLEKPPSDVPIIKMVSNLFLRAYECRASDIHLECLSNGFRVRFRIDGALQEVQNLPRLLQTAIINRLKIMSGSMSLAEKRLPQDGRIHFQLQECNSLDLRVSTIPTIHGESAVIRILEPSSLALSELGLVSEDQTILENLMNSANGMILITGPTGSGKTTTLYACLHSINKPDRKLITVEDPIEYQISGINQVQVNLETGMTFPVALRSILRQAPNILMIGEIRDSETAHIAIHASITGHLIFSTLHTNDAPSAIARLLDMGIPPFLISGSVRAIIAQRLVRRLCPHCKKPTQLAPYECRFFNVERNVSGTPMAAVGCSACHGKGYKGRMGIFEIFVLDEEAYHMINRSASPLHLLRLHAGNTGMHSLREDGIRKVLAGLTTAQEILATTPNSSQ